MSQTKRWSTKVNQRRLSWLGHPFRCQEDTPAEKALEEHLRPIKRSQEKLKITWISVVNKDLRYGLLGKHTVSIKSLQKPWNMSAKTYKIKRNRRP